MLNIPQEKLTAIKNFAHQYIFKLLCQQDIPFILAHLDPQLIGIGAAVVTTAAGGIDSVKTFPDFWQLGCADPNAIIANSTDRIFTVTL